MKKLAVTKYLQQLSYTNGKFTKTSDDVTYCYIVCRLQSVWHQNVDNVYDSGHVSSTHSWYTANQQQHSWTLQRKHQDIAAVLTLSRDAKRQMPSCRDTRSSEVNSWHSMSMMPNWAWHLINRSTNKQTNKQHHDISNRLPMCRRSCF